jgi:hypothetical protein
VHVATTTAMAMRIFMPQPQLVGLSSPALKLILHGLDHFGCDRFVT